MKESIFILFAVVLFFIISAWLDSRREKARSGRIEFTFRNTEVYRDIQKGRMK